MCYLERGRSCGSDDNLTTVVVVMLDNLPMVMVVMLDASEGADDCYRTARSNTIGRLAMLESPLGDSTPF